MATVNRPPFWVPRPGYDEPWQPPAVWINSGAITATRTQVKIFGQPGQGPTKRWLPHLTYDDPPMWQGSPLNSAPITVTRTQVKVFGQPGQAPTKRWLPYLLYDDPPMWQGPINNWLDSGAIELTNTQVKFFGQHGQAPPFRPNFTYDDASPWQWPSYERNRNVLFVQTQASGIRPWLWSDDASGWSGEPVNSAVIQQLTAQKLFGQGGQTPPFRPSWYSEDSFWQGSPTDAAPIAILTAQRVFGQGGQVPPFRPNSTYDDASTWWPAIERNQGLLSQTRNPFSNRAWQWSDDAPGWQPAAALNIGLLQQAATLPRSPFYVSRPSDDFLWNNGPAKSFALSVPTSQAPFSNLQLRWCADETQLWNWKPTNASLTLASFHIYSPRSSWAYWQFNEDPSVWQWSEAGMFNRNLLQTAGTPFVANFPDPYLDDATTWSWGPVAANPNLFAPPTPTLFRSPFYVSRPSDDFLWNNGPAKSFALSSPPTTNPFSNAKAYWYCEDTAWQWTGVAQRNPNLFQPSTAFPTSPTRLWRWDYDVDASSWLAAPVAANPNVFAPPTPTLARAPFYGQRPSDDSQWQLLATRNPNLFAPAGSIPFSPSRWNYLLDDAAAWSGAPRGSSLVDASFHLYSPRSSWVYWQFNDDAPPWQGSPHQATVILNTTQTKFYGQPGQVPPFRWNQTLDDPSVWYATPVAANPNIFAPPTPRLFRAPFYGPRPSDDFLWYFSPRTSLTLSLPVPPPPTSFPNDWINFRRRARRR